MATLDDRIAALPQELQDIILEFTLDSLLDVPSSGIVTITLWQKPPVSLQISRALWTKFATRYYGGRTFKAAEVLGFVCIYWLEHLQPEHRAMIQGIEFHNGVVRHNFVAETRIRGLLQLWSEYGRRLRYPGEVAEKFVVCYTKVTRVSAGAVGEVRIPLSSSEQEAQAMIYHPWDKAV